MWIYSAKKCDFAQICREDAKHKKDIGILGAGRNAQVRSHRPGDLGYLRKRLRHEGQPVAISHKADLGFSRWRLPRKRLVFRIEIKSGPACGRQRPIALMPFDEFVDMANLKLNLRLLVPAVRFALEVEVEKPALQL